MEVTFTIPKKITIREPEIIEADRVLVNEVIDYGTSVDALITPQKTGQMPLMEKTKRVILWQGEDYKAIGQWTDTDVVNRLKEIL